MMSVLWAQRTDLLQRLCNLLYVDYVAFDDNVSRCFSFVGA